MTHTNLTETIEDMSTALRNSIEIKLGRSLSDDEFSYKVLQLAHKAVSILEEGFVYEM